jgi:hypothetical protein
LGLTVRNRYGLWRGNRALLEDACRDWLQHPDHAAAVIIEAHLESAPAVAAGSGA